MSLPSCASKKNHLISDVSNSLEESCCISASCWLHIWRIQLSILTDNFTALVRALRSWYNLIALWDCIFFHILCLSRLNFGAVYWRASRWLYMTCGGFSWTICFSLYSWWYLLGRSCPDQSDWSPLHSDPSLSSWFLWVFHLPCHIILDTLIELQNYIHRIFALYGQLSP